MNTADWLNMGHAFFTQKNYKTALECYDRAGANLPDAMVSRANCLSCLNRPLDALDTAAEAAEKFPYNDQVWHAGAFAAERLGDFKSAKEGYSTAMELNPHNPEAYANAAHVCRALGEYEEAKTLYRTALSLNPAHFTARLHLSMVELLLGEWDSGLNNYEIRIATNNPLPFNGKPIWTGESIEGKVLALYAEQGIGDTIQFARYCKLIKEELRPARIVVYAQDVLYRLLCAADGIDEVHGSVTDYFPYDVHTSLMSVPYILRRKGIWGGPEWIKYLTNGFDWMPFDHRIGVCWKGNPQHVQDRWRSLSLKDLGRLTSQSYRPLVSLQFGESETARGMGIKTPLLGDMLDLAKQILSCEMVVTVDTAIAHLAGSLEVPTIMLIPPNPDWRWGFGGDSTPWYPSMMIVRAKKFGDWTEAIESTRALAGIE